MSLNKVFVLISFGRQNFLSVKYTKKWLALSKSSISTTGPSKMTSLHMPAKAQGFQEDEEQLYSGRN